MATATGLGADLSCVSDLDPGMVEVSGRTCLAQAIARRLTTPRGRLIDDPNYGYDLSQFLNDDLTDADLARIASSASAECLKDERVNDADVAISLSSAGVMMVTVQLVDGQGPFTLVLAVSEVSTSILAVTR